MALKYEWRGVDGMGMLYGFVFKGAKQIRLDVKVKHVPQLEEKDLPLFTAYFDGELLTGEASTLGQAIVMLETHVMKHFKLT